jgi:hypothetical protein
MDPPQWFRSDGRMNPAFLILMLAAAAVPAADPGENPPDPAIADHIDILAPGRQGQVQCFQPNLFEKTCKIMATYSFGDDGQVTGTAQMLMDETGPAVLVVSAPVAVKDGALCGQLDALPNARFVVAGQPATSSQDAAYRLMLSMMPRRGEVCARWIGDGDGYIVHGSLDGKPKKDFDQRMIWVEPDEGFKVSP